MGRGQWGEVFSGTAIKDTWTKPREGVEAREGGGLKKKKIWIIFDPAISLLEIYNILHVGK